MNSSARLSREDILRLFDLLNEELSSQDVQGELYLVGGAVMCLVLDARPSTRDVDSFFRPADVIREAAARVADRVGVSRNWLNDGVKGYLSPRGDFDLFLDLTNLKAFVARPEYVLAMKCAAMRLGEEFQDLDDVRFLLRYLNLSSMDEAFEVITRYFDESQLPAKTRFALEELLPRAR